MGTTHTVKEGGIPEEEKKKGRKEEGGRWQTGRNWEGVFRKKKIWASGLWALELHKRWC